MLKFYIFQFLIRRVFDAGISLILVSNKMTSYYAGILLMQHEDSYKRKAFNPGLC